MSRIANATVFKSFCMQAQQLERIFAASIHHVALQFAQTGELHANVRGIRHNHR